MKTPGWHTHRCSACGHRWSHGAENKGDVAAHTCPNGCTAYDHWTDKVVPVVSWFHDTTGREELGGAAAPAPNPDEEFLLGLLDALARLAASEEARS